MEQALEIYLDKIDRRLRPMSALERSDIVREIHSEMQELECHGLTAQEIIQRLGTPKDLAAAYLENAITKDPGLAGLVWGRWRHFIAWRD